MMRYSKHLRISVVLVLFSTVLSAASTPKETLYEWILHHFFVLAFLAIFLLGIFYILKLSVDLLAFGTEKRRYELGLESKPASASKSLLKSWYDKLWSVVPVAQEQSIDLGHDYDGIRELDNRLPPWWLYLFYGCIAFAGIYMYIYHFSDNDWSSRNEYALAMIAGDEARAERMARIANSVNESSVALLTDEESLAEGKEIFIERCASCHGQMGEGLVGPNFTDEYWVHGGGIKDLFKTIKYGVPDKGMISWKTQINPVKMQQVASYILTLQGTNPPNQKAAEGTLYVPEEVESSQDN